MTPMDVGVFNFLPLLMKEACALANPSGIALDSAQAEISIW